MAHRRILQGCLVMGLVGSCKHAAPENTSEQPTPAANQQAELANSVPVVSIRSAVVKHRNEHNAKIRADWEAMTGYSAAATSASWKKFPHGCEEGTAGGEVKENPALFSKNGVLAVTFSYQTSVAADGNVKFCYRTADGKQNPNLHLKPGDHLKLTLRNDTPVSQSAATMAMDMSSPGTAPCGSSIMTNSTTNLHYHGTNTRPVCHQDEVIRTMVNSGETFNFDLAIPADEPPGLYWYHPHIHGLAEAAVPGGASGALIVDGLGLVTKEVQNLRHRTFVLRDQLLPTTATVTDSTPAWDISINGTPILSPDYVAPTLTMSKGKSEFWRVVNTAGDAMFDLQVVYDGVPQSLKVVALDAVPTNSQNNQRKGKAVTKTNYILAPGNRVEFIVAPPGPSVKVAKLITRQVDTGPGGDFDPERPLLNLRLDQSIKAAAALSSPVDIMPVETGTANPQRFAGLDAATPVAQRKLYFMSVDTATDTDFFVVVDGQTPVKFDPSLPPAITTTQGSTEDWVIENHTDELHSFHIHQIHFLLLERNGVPVPPEERQYLDVINVPYWDGVGPYPSVKVRMDFRGPYVGDFVYHCHILEHEDKGMMAIIRVKPKA